MTQDPIKLAIDALEAQLKQHAELRREHRYVHDTDEMDHAHDAIIYLRALQSQPDTDGLGKVREALKLVATGTPENGLDKYVQSVAQEALAIIDQQAAHKPWKLIETAPRDGEPFYVRELTPMRFKPYSKKSNEYRNGMKGRWQRMNDYGGWDNCPDAKPIEWCSNEDGNAFLSSAAAPDLNGGE